MTARLNKMFKDIEIALLAKKLPVMIIKVCRLALLMSNLFMRPRISYQLNIDAKNMTRNTDNDRI